MLHHLNIELIVLCISSSILNYILSICVHVFASK